MLTCFYFMTLRGPPAPARLQAPVPCSSLATTSSISSTGRQHPLLPGHRRCIAGLITPLQASLLGSGGLTPAQAAVAVGSGLPLAGQVRCCGALSRVKVPKREGFNDTVMPNSTQLKHGAYGIRAVTGRRVAANIIEAVRRWAGRERTTRLGVGVAVAVGVAADVLARWLTRALTALS